MTRRLALLLAAAACAAGGAAAPAAAAAAWSAPATFSAGAVSDGSELEPIPRGGIARDGTAAAAWTTDSGALVVSTRSPGGRFGPAKMIDRSGASDWSVAAGRGGAVLVAWEDGRSLRVAVRRRAGVRFVVRRVAGTTGSGIDSLQVAADPRGGWVLAEAQFGGAREDFGERVRAITLDAAGRRVGAPQPLGDGEFGSDGRQTDVLAVGADGRAVVTFTGASGDPDEDSGDRVLVASRPHRGRFSTPVPVPDGGVAEPRVALGEDGAAGVAVTLAAECGEANCFGGPGAARLDPGGAPAEPFGPRLANPRRAFGSTAAFGTGGRGTFVFQLKTRSAAFSNLAPVRAVAFGPDERTGRLQTLTGRNDATEPVALGIAGGRSLAVWSDGRGMRSALAGPSGRFLASGGPDGPPPPRFHSNSTNRDVRAAGRWAIVAWAAGERVRISVRRF